MALEKAILKDLDNDEEIEVLFNPREYQLEKQVLWPEHHVQGLDSPAIQFTSGERQVLSMELFFDTSDSGEDVRDHTGKVETLMLIDADLHRPPLVMFSWGRLRFRGVLEDLAQRFTMFKEDGTPIRANLRVVFREFVSGSTQFQENPRNSADHTKIKQVEQGETLSSIAAREYKDPGKWRVIAEANKTEDPMALKPGQQIKIPPIT